MNKILIKYLNLNCQDVISVFDYSSLCFPIFLLLKYVKDLFSPLYVKYN